MIFSERQIAYQKMCFKDIVEEVTERGCPVYDKCNEWDEEVSFAAGGRPDVLYNATGKNAYICGEHYGVMDRDMYGDAYNRWSSVPSLTYINAPECYILVSAKSAIKNASIILGRASLLKLFMESGYYGRYADPVINSLDIQAGPCSEIHIDISVVERQEHKIAIKAGTCKIYCSRFRTEITALDGDVTVSILGSTFTVPDGANFEIRRLLSKITQRDVDRVIGSQLRGIRKKEKEWKRKPVTG